MPGQTFLRCYVSLSALLVAGVSIAACSSSGSNNVVDRPGDGGNGGTGGTGGSRPGGAGGTAGGGGTAAEDAGGAGAGGRGLPESCDTDADCDDGLACTGDESCVAGECSPGEPVECVAEDHCAAECMESARGPACSVSALDSDADGESSALCVEVPGDDCDDTDDAVHPGATEACDGIDSDCDGAEDIEAFSLHGTPVNPGSGGLPAAVAWSSELERFAMVYFGQPQGGSLGTQSVSIAADGEIISQAVTGINDYFSVPSLAPGHGAFGLVWLDSGSNVVYFQRVSATGALEGSAEIVSRVRTTVSQTAVVATASGWVAFWSGSSEAVFGRRLNADGTVGTGVSLGVAGATQLRNELATAAVRGDEIALAWQATDGIRFARLSDELVPIQEKRLSGVGKEAHIVANAAGYAVAWIENNKLTFAELDEQGTVLCGAVDLGYTSLAASAELALAPYAGGHVVLFSDNAVAPRMLLLRVQTGCSAVLPPEVVGDAAANTKAAVQLHGDDRGLIAAWTEPGPLRSYFRVFGPNLCDAPRP